MYTHSLQAQGFLEVCAFFLGGGGSGTFGCNKLVYLMKRGVL